MVKIIFVFVKMVGKMKLVTSVSHIGIALIKAWFHCSLSKLFAITCDFQSLLSTFQNAKKGKVLGKILHCLLLFKNNYTPLI